MKFKNLQHIYLILTLVFVFTISFGVSANVYGPDFQFDTNPSQNTQPSMNMDSSFGDGVGSQLLFFG